MNSLGVLGASAAVPVLLVDAAGANLAGLAAQLGQLDGVDVVAAPSGEEALRQLLRRDFALVLMDLQMPGMDGAEVAALMRANPKTRHIPIVFVGAPTDPADCQARGYASGAVDYLVTPIASQVLHAKLGIFIQLYRQRQTQQDEQRRLAQVSSALAGRADPSAPEQLRVLMVDDHPENLLALEALLGELHDVQLVRANSGAEALCAVLREDFAVILMDVQMPGMDGFETAERLRADPKTLTVPIIFVTAGMREPEFQFKGYELGAVDYLIKPLEPVVLCSKVRVFCQLYRQRQALERQGAYLDVLVAERTAQLQRSADKLALATRAARLGVWDWDLVTDTLSWDARMYALCGVAPGQLGDAHATWAATVHPDDRAALASAMARALRKESVFDIEFRVCWPDASVHVIQADAQVLWDDAGRAVRMTGVHADITARKRADDDLRRHRDHLQELVDERSASLRAIVDNAADGIVTIDARGLVLSFNRAAERMFGYRAEQVLGQSVKLLMPDTYRLRHDEQLHRFDEHGVAGIIGSGRELAGRRADGSEFPLHVAISQMEVGGARRFTGLLRDISAQKATEAKLTAARHAAEAANQVKSEFLARMSHELRTPLNAVIGFSHLMARSPGLSAEHQRNLDIIHRSGQHLLTLINSVLELSKIDAGRAQLQEEDTDLAVLLRGVIDTLDMRAREAGLALLLELDQLPRSVRVDAVKLRQVLFNLLGNAIKFTEHGQVCLAVHGAAQDGARVRLTFRVVDTGIGVAPQHLAAIFEPFLQLSTHATSAGTGLGLTISRQFVQLLGGELQVESTPGQGSAFFFSLSLAVSDAAPGALDAARLWSVTGLAPELRGKRALVVDDDADSRTLLATLLTALGFAVEQCADGFCALARLAEFAPELIFMDWRMPDMDGLETIRRMRAQPAGTQARIVMCSASAFDEERASALAGGANAFLRKPLDEAELCATIEEQLQLVLQREAARAGAVPAAQLGPVLAGELAGLPAPVRAALQQAAVELNAEKMAEALAELGALDAALAARCAQMVAAYQFRELWQLLDGAA